MSAENTAQRAWRPLSPLPNAETQLEAVLTQLRSKGKRCPPHTHTHTHTCTHTHRGRPDSAEVQGEKVPSTHTHTHTPIAP